jgi:hypothetical protein
MKKDQTTVDNYKADLGYFLTKEYQDATFHSEPISDKDELLTEFKKALNNLRDGEKIVVKATKNFYLGSQNNQ